MIKTGDIVIVINKNLQIFGKIGRVLLINEEMKNCYIIIENTRFLVDLKDIVLE